MPAACQNHNVVVRQVGDQRTKIECHRCFPVSCRTYDAVDAPGIDHQTAVSKFPNVLQEPEHCATRPAVLPCEGAVPEHFAREKPVDAGGAGHKICQLPIQEIENFQRHQDARPILGKLVRVSAMEYRAYEFRDFVGSVDLAKHDHPVLPQERDVLDVRSHAASVRDLGVRATLLPATLTSISLPDAAAVGEEAGEWIVAAGLGCEASFPCAEQAVPGLLRRNSSLRISPG